MMRLIVSVASSVCSVEKLLDGAVDFGPIVLAVDQPIAELLL